MQSTFNQNKYVTWLYKYVVPCKVPLIKINTSLGYINMLFLNRLI